MDDRDIEALRDFRSELDEPRDGALAKGRWQLAHADRPAPARRRRWIPATVSAAAGVAVVVGAAALLNPGAQPGQAGGPGEPSPPAVAASTTGKPLPVEHGTKAPVNPPVTGAGDATGAKAVAALDRLATAAAGAQPWPVPLGDGKVLYVKSYNLREGDGRYVHEVWQDPATAVPLRIRRTDGAVTSIDDTSSLEEIQQAVAQPPGLMRPTPEYLASLPADSAAVHNAWRSAWEADYPGRGEQVLWKDLYELFHYSEPFWTPQQRATIYGAIGRIGGVVGTTATIGGRGYDVICRGTECMLFDSADGRYAGNASTGADHVVKADGLDLVDFGVQPRPEPGAAKTPVEKKVIDSTTTPKR